MPDNPEHLQGVLDFDTPRLLFTIPEAARALAIGRSTVYELVTAGDLRVVHVGRAVRVPVDELKRYVARLQGAGPKKTVVPAR